MKYCWQRHIVFLLGLMLAWPSLLFAAPQMTWSDQIDIANRSEQRQPVTLDLRSIWQATRVGEVHLANAQYLDPEQVWSWNAERFERLTSREAYFLRSNERLVARVTLFSEMVGTDLNLSAVLPRLDAMHVSYRYDNGAWTTLSAGDTLPINSWLVPDRHPTFHIPQLKGQMDLVVQLAHRGSAFAPMVLQNERARIAQLTTDAWTVGLMGGVLLIMALVGVLLAIHFKRNSFLVIFLMNVTITVLIFFSSGLGGLYVGTGSETFNDQIKFFFNTTICLVLPLVAATVLGLQQRSKRWRIFTACWLTFGMLGTSVWMDYAWRDTTAVGVPILLISTYVIVMGMVCWSVFRYASLQPVTLLGLILYALSLIVPFTGFLGVFLSTESLLGAAALMLLSSLLLIQGLHARHRMGNQVMARASLSALRDVLTGLLSREGMQAHLYNKVRSRVQSDQTSAVFIYINVMDADQAMREHGEQGFEMGMVQMAASLSTSVSGVDGVARISRHAFAISVLMPPNPALATRLAQKILSRLMALASHGVPLAGTARIAMAWLPLFGFRVDSLERRSLRALDELEPVKRIGWVGGSESHAEAAQMQLDAGASHSTPSGLEPFIAHGNAAKKEGVSSNLYERIHRIEREMLHGVDTRFLVAEAERMSRALNEAHSSQGSSKVMDESQRDDSHVYAPTELLQSSTQSGR